MEQSDNLALPFIAASQDQKHITHNEALRMVDALLHLSVIDQDKTVAPSSANDGDRHIVAASAAGDWSGKDLQIAAWQMGAWVFYPPRNGWLVWVEAESALFAWQDTEWISAGNTITELQNLSLLGVNTTADATNKLAVSSAASLFNHAGGSHRVKVNKNAVADTASHLFQTNWSGRAEMGLTGSDNFQFKVSPDGTNWHDAMEIDCNTGAVDLVGIAPVTYTPNVRAQGGTLGSNPPTATGSYFKLGPLTFYDITITFPSDYSAGSPAPTSSIEVSIPAAPTVNMDNGQGREVAVVGTVLVGLGFVGYDWVRINKMSDLSIVAGDNYQLHMQFYVYG